MLVQSGHVSILFFFFQAEDGIRDYKVTGVQTCALPISAFVCFIPTLMEEMAEPVHFIPQQSQLTSPTFDHTPARSPGPGLTRPGALRSSPGCPATPGSSGKAPGCPGSGRSQTFPVSAS